MSKFLVEKSGPLKGTIHVSGAKNAVLPIMAGAILSPETCVLEDIPNLSDVQVMSEVIEALGAKVTRMPDGIMEIFTPEITNCEAPYELVNKMRASFYVMGPLLARYGRARVPMPGGCAIGSRPIDLHLKGFAALGARIELGHGYVEAVAEKLIGATIYLDFPSVGATENIMMAATMAEGITLIENAAEEPEIIDLANFLNKIGADIKGAGTDTLRIKGVKSFHGARHAVIPDRIESGTYMIASAITGGDLIVNNVVSSHLKPLIAKLRESGAIVHEMEDSVRVIGTDSPKAVDITTLPYPGFPTDLQAQFMALMATANGSCTVIETVFENRFMHVSELNRMGAKIRIEGHGAVLQGNPHLQGAQVNATDLRAGAALILAGMAAEGITEIHDIQHIERGYDNIEEKLRGVGVNIRKVSK